MFALQILVRKTDTNVGCQCVNGVKLEHLVRMVGAQLPSDPVKEDTTTVTTSLEFGSTPNPLTFNFDCTKWS